MRHMDECRIGAHQINIIGGTAGYRESLLGTGNPGSKENNYKSPNNGADTLHFCYHRLDILNVPPTEL